MKRHEAREKAFQILFQLDLLDEDMDQTIQDRLTEEKQDDFLHQIVNGVVKEKEAIDQKISENLEKWSLQRLPAVEKAVLRIATFEILHIKDIPENVSINEAVELAKRYGDDKSGRFVNGVLSKVIK